MGCLSDRDALGEAIRPVRALVFLCEDPMDMLQSPVSLTTALGRDALALHRMRGHEALSELFVYELEAEGEHDLALNALLGEPITVSLELTESELRHFNGIVSEIELVHGTEESATYRILVRPWLWALTRGSNSRIFQNLTIPEIVKQVLRDRGYSDFEERLTEEYERQEFIVQYRESDYDFVERLLERAGIHFFFVHDQATHRMVLADSRAAHEPLPGCESLDYHPPDRQRHTHEQYVYAWKVGKTVQPGAVACSSFDFEKPKTKLRVTSAQKQAHALADAEVFDHAGGYRDCAEGEAIARRRLERLQMDHEIAYGETNARGLSAGWTLRLAGHPRDDQNREYLVVATECAIRVPLHASGGVSSDEPIYQAVFTALDVQRPFRAAAPTRVPRILGPQTAIVAGKDGEEIWTDSHGRVKVQFHWDRYGQGDENSSCWVRVAQAWAGNRLGTHYVPRIGQEVVVEFLDGDPDRPLITGSVYNGENRSAHDLPGGGTRSGIRSQSVKSGPGAFNELVFDDQKGSELLSMQAQKDMTLRVKDAQTVSVGTSRTTTIGAEDTTTIKKNSTLEIGGDQDRTVKGARTTVIRGADSLTIRGARTATVKRDLTTLVEGCEVRTVRLAQSVTVFAARVIAAGSEAITAGLRSVTAAMQVTTVAGKRTVSAGSNTVSVRGASTHTAQQNYTLGVGKALRATGAEEVVLRSGQASITLRKSGQIDITGRAITINGNRLTLKGSDAIVVKGGKIAEN